MNRIKQAKPSDGGPCLAQGGFTHTEWAGERPHVVSRLSDSSRARTEMRKPLPHRLQLLPFVVPVSACSLPAEPPVALASLPGTIQLPASDRQRRQSRFPFSIRAARHRAGPRAGARKRLTNNPGGYTGCIPTRGGAERCVWVPGGAQPRKLLPPRADGRGCVFPVSSSRGFQPAL